ncbi:unnamed protein product, partial [Allacma fusca]
PIFISPAQELPNQRGRKSSKAGVTLIKVEYRWSNYWEIQLP